MAEEKKGKVVEATIVAPEQITISGEIVGVNEMKNKSNEVLGTLVTIYDAKTGQHFKAITSDGQLEKFTADNKKYADIVVKGNQLSVVLEKHVEGVTSYKDDKGVIQSHKSSGYSLREVIGLSTFESIALTTRAKDQVKYDLRRENLAKDIKEMRTALMAAGFSDEEIKEQVAMAMKI
jgi:hypothetical protein